MAGKMADRAENGRPADFVPSTRQGQKAELLESLTFWHSSFRDAGISVQWGMLGVVQNSANTTANGATFSQRRLRGLYSQPEYRRSQRCASIVRAKVVTSSTIRRN